MTFDRSVTLVGSVLLALLTSAIAAEPAPAGENKISGLAVHQDVQGRWLATFDYVYSGDPPFAVLGLQLRGTDKSPGDLAPPAGAITHLKPAERGVHHETIEILHPYGGAYATEPITTTQVAAVLNWGGRPIAEQSVALTIRWPDARTWFAQREEASKPADEVVDECVDLIDAGTRNGLQEARRRLERLLAKQPDLDQAYVELARVAMKTNWGPEGLHHAESLLQSALQIRPDSVNAKILMGYVYTHQARDQLAEAMFVDAARAKTKNLWLWSNWGELLAGQGKTDLAIQKYREAVSRPRAHDTYDRARLDAYDHLLVLLERKGDLDVMEALHKQRAQEYPGSCFSADHARFVLQRRGDVAAGIVLAREAVEGGCRDSIARDVLGMAHYMAWAGAEGAPRTASLNQARVFLPPGAKMFHLLASADLSAKAAQQLIAAGESVDQRDNDKYTALAYALQDEDLGTAGRLLRLGAQPTAPVGGEDMPVAILPVLANHLDAIRLLRQFGVDYSKLRYRGATAIDHARQLGDRRLLEALDPKSGNL